MMPPSPGTSRGTTPETNPEAGIETGLEAGPAPSLYDRLLAEDKANEERILWSELAVFAILGFVALAYFIVR